MASLRSLVQTLLGRRSACLVIPSRARPLATIFAHAHQRSAVMIMWSQVCEIVEEVVAVVVEAGSVADVSGASRRSTVDGVPRRRRGLAARSGRGFDRCRRRWRRGRCYERTMASPYRRCVRGHRLGGRCLRGGARWWAVVEDVDVAFAGEFDCESEGVVGVRRLKRVESAWAERDVADADVGEGESEASGGSACRLRRSLRLGRSTSRARSPAIDRPRSCS